MTKSYETNRTNFTVRTADELDAALILHFIKALAAYEKMSDEVIATEKSIYESLFVHKQAEVLLAFEDNNPIGFALFFQTYSTFQGKANLFLEDIYLDESYRHKGYGKILFSILAQIATERNCLRIDWYCLDWNQKSIDFYHSIGAHQLNEWIVFRLKDENIAKLSNIR